MFESDGKLELDCAPTEGAIGAAANCSSSPTSIQTSSDGGTIDVASVVSLTALSSDGVVGSIAGADSDKICLEPNTGGMPGSTANIETSAGAGA